MFKLKKLLIMFFYQNENKIYFQIIYYLKIL